MWGSGSDEMVMPASDWVRLGALSFGLWLALSAASFALAIAVIG
jgi:hypothetical protein